MGFLRTHLTDPRLHFLGALVLVIAWIAGSFGPSDAAQCPECPGHLESIRDCVCSHTPAANLINPARPQH